MRDTRTVTEIIDDMDKDYQALVKAFTDELVRLKEKTAELEAKNKILKEKMK